MLAARGVRLALQAAYFIIIARCLGPEQYGAFVAAAAIVGIIAPFAAIGTGYLLVKNVSRDPKLLSECWGNSLLVTCTSGIVLLLAIVLCAQWLLPSSVPVWVILFIGVADLVFARILETAGLAFQAHDRLSRTAQLNVLLNLLRVLAALPLLLLSGRADATTWAFCYLASTLVAAITALALVNRELGHPRINFARILGELGEGMHFSIGLSAQGVYNDLDKSMLARFATLQAAGFYGAAYRIIDLAFAPVGSLVYATYANFFRHGSDGINATSRYARRLLLYAGLYCIVALVLMHTMAPVLPYILGEDFSGAVAVIEWLAILPLLKAFHYFAANALTGAGFQGTRSAVQVGVAVFNFAMNLWLIPAYSWKGAVCSSLASDGLLALALWVAVCVLSKRPVQASPARRKLRPETV